MPLSQQFLALARGSYGVAAADDILIFRRTIQEATAELAARGIVRSGAAVARYRELAARHVRNQYDVAQEAIVLAAEAYGGSWKRSQLAALLDVAREMVAPNRRSIAADTGQAVRGTAVLAEDTSDDKLVPTGAGESSARMGLALFLARQERTRSERRWQFAQWAGAAVGGALLSNVGLWLGHFVF